MAIKYQFVDTDLIYDNLFDGATAEELRAEFEKVLATQVARYKEAKQKQIEHARSAFIARFLDYASALDIDIDIDIPKEGYTALEADLRGIEAEVTTNQKVADIVNKAASKEKNDKICKKLDDAEILRQFFENL